MVVAFVMGLFFLMSHTTEMCALSCPTLCRPMDCSLLGFSVHGIFPGKNTGVGCHFLFKGIFPSREDLPGPGIKPALADRFLTTE